MRITVGEFATFEVPDADVVSARRDPAAPDLPDPAAALRAALDAPHHFPSLRRALTPDDRVAIVVDDRLPRLGELVPALLNYVTEAGVNPAAITLVSPAGSRQA